MDPERIKALLAKTKAATQAVEKKEEALAKPAPIPTTELGKRIQELSAALLTQHPSLPVLLRDIHKRLRDDPNIVTILTEEEITTIVSGYKTHTQITSIATQMATKGKALKNISVDDI